MSNRPWWIWGGACLLVVVGLYLLLGFFAVPEWIQNELTQYVEEELRLESHPGMDVSFNPMTFVLTVRNGSFRDGGTDVLRFDAVWADFELVRSIYGWKPVLDDVVIDGPRIHLERDSEGRLNWQRILERRRTGESQTGGVVPLYLHRFRLREGAISWEDRVGEPVARFTVDQLSVQADTIQLPADQGLPFQVEGRLGDEGRLVSSGELSPSDGSLEAKFSLEQVPLRLTNDYLGRRARVRWNRGTAGVRGHLRKGIDGSGLTLDSSVRLEDAELVNDRDTTVVAWEHLRVDNVRLNPAEFSVRLEDVQLTKPYLRLLIEEGYKTNLGALMKPPGTVQPDTDASKERESPGWNVVLGPTTIRSARMDFRDENVPGTFSSRIYDLEGTVGPLHSPGSKPASLELAGKAGDQARLTVSGTVDPFSTDNPSEVSMEFRNIALVPLSPYLIKFAGYRVDQGKLRLELKYELLNRKLDGRNNVVIERFQLGEKVSEDPVLSLPVRLIVALLKDQNGVIEVNVPVSGDLDDPQLSVGKVIRHAVTNTFTNIVSSPFTFLANLVGTSEEDLRTVAFRPGEAELSPSARETVRKLAEALKKRPALHLEIRPGWTKTDRNVLAHREVEARIVEQGGEPDQPAESREVLERLYRRVYSPESLVELRATHVPDGDTGVVDVETYARDLFDKLVERVEVTEETLRELGRSRAENLRSTFEGHGVDPERIFVLDAHPLETTSEGGTVFPVSVRAP